jgi:sulfatase modifying factor 1
VRCAFALAIPLLISACDEPSLRLVALSEPVHAQLVVPTPQRCPSEMARVGNACIDRWEAHLVRQVGAGQPTVHPYSARPKKGVVYHARSRAGVKPQAYISRIEASRACAAADKRLCTRSEWQSACRGDRDQVYPYGNVFRAGVCNVGKRNLMALTYGLVASRWTNLAFNNPNLNKLAGYLSATGAHEGCATSEGVYDMVGNVHEWVSDRATQSFADSVNAEGVKRIGAHWREGNAVFMGGFYSTTDEHGPGCHFTTPSHAASYHDYSTGFRCCAD